jgi:hypothetical protein
MALKRTVCQQPWRRTAKWFTPWTRGVLVGLIALGIYAGNGLLAADEPAKGLPSVQIEPLPKGIVFAVVFSKDGRQIALACEDKTVAVHDAKTGKEVARLEGHSERVWTAAFSPDGGTLASCSGEYARPEDGGAVKIWDLKTGKEKASLEGHRGLVFHVTFSPDGKTLLSAGWDGTVRLWDVAMNKEKTILKDHTGPVRTIVFARQVLRYRQFRRHRSLLGRGHGQAPKNTEGSYDRSAVRRLLALWQVPGDDRPTDRRRA